MDEFNRTVQRYLDSRRPFVTATVVRVKGSASAKPGSKALIDEQGRNVYGWVGGGCAESLVREQALEALDEGSTRIVDVDLDDEVLGVGMPCGGHMQVYIEPHFPPKTLLVAGHNRLAQHLAMLGGLAGYAVTVHAPKAQRENFPAARLVLSENWDSLAIPPGSFMVVATDHEGHLPALRMGLNADPAYLALVARRSVSHELMRKLGHEGFGAGVLSTIRTPAGLDLGGPALEEVSLSILAEIATVERGSTGLPLRMIKSGLEGPVLSSHQSGDASREADGSAAPRTVPDLLIVGQGRLAEELASLGTLMRWRVTVNATDSSELNLPGSVRVVTGDLDFSRMDVGPNTHVVIATLHKGDHLSMQKALAGNAAYIGLIASKKRSGLVLDYLREAGFGIADMSNVHAPAGLDLGAITPSEIAQSVMSEAIAVRHGGSCGALGRITGGAADGEPAADEVKPESCRSLFD